MFILFFVIIILLSVALAPSLIIFSLPHKTYRIATGQRLPVVKLTLINMVLVFIVMLVVNTMHTLHGSILELTAFIMWVSIPTAGVLRGFLGQWYKRNSHLK
ncbi:MAG: hypothetical protein RLZZ422_1392 [Pseudomonadota bacterium]|jgi:hypothetical protein